jgi:hypothetical protein
MSIIGKIQGKINQKINSFVRRTQWFSQEMFGDCEKFWSHKTYNLDLINLGSGAAKYGFDYSGIDLKTANWAMMPQTLVGDKVILENYLSFLKPDKAIVIITICPFSCLDDGKNYLPDKIYTVADMLSIPEFAYERKLKIYDVKLHPLKYFPMMSIFAEIKHLGRRVIKRKVTSESLKNNVNFWIDSWKKQFSIYNLSDEFSLVNKDRFELSVKALDNLIRECLAHSFKPVIILPPVSKYLLECFDKDFQQRFIYDFLQSSNYKDVKFFNYLGDKEFADDCLYRNANFLNAQGAKKFTKRVISDLRQAEIIKQ